MFNLEDSLQETDSESLDRCIQTSLSDLYPPFQATSSTILCQVLSVVESSYSGDGLRYLLHFLLPAKKFLQTLQQHACCQYSGVLFRHEGWPLCVHEKVVVQLCPLDQHLLRPGDFYLLVSPAAAPPLRAHSASCRSSVASSPSLLLCSVSAGGRHVERQEVSELALRSLFSMAWLDSVNREREPRGASRLERCVLSANGDVFRVPWEDLVYPQFLSRARTTRVEDQESSMKEELVSRDINSLTQEDLKLLPSQTNQSAASSEAEDSEGEYVELTELTLPRFSPQKGSLTQSISLQLQARTSSHSSTHTPHNKQIPHNTHTPHSTHTPHNTHTAHNTHTPHNTHAPHNTHTPQNTHTHSAVSMNTSTHTPHNKLTPLHTHSSWSSVQVSSHTGLCTKLIEENFKHDTCRPVVLTPISPSNLTPTSSAPPEVLETAIVQSEQEASKEQTQGSDSVCTLNTEPQNSHGQREEEEEEEELKQGEQRKEGEMEEKREEGELMKSQERKHETLVSVDEAVEKEEEEEMRTAEEEEDESEEMEGDGEEEFDEEEAEELELEEEVQVIIVQQSQERREEEEAMREEERGKDEEERGRQTHIDKEACSRMNAHAQDSYSENYTLHTQSKDSYCENVSLQTHPEDFCSENNKLHTHSKDSYSESIHDTPSEESNAPQTLSKDSYSENTSLKTHSKDSYSESIHDTQSEESNAPQTLSKDSYSENTSLKTHSKDSYSESIHDTPSEESNAPQTLSKDSYSEKIHETPSEEPNAPQTLSKDSYSEKIHDTPSEESNAPQTLSKDSYCENIHDTPSEESSSPQTLSKDSYSENPSPQTLSKDSYSEKIHDTQSEESNAPQTLSKDSYSENTSLKTHSKDSYSESIHDTPSEESNAPQTLSKDSYSEKIHDTPSEESNAPQTLSKDSYSEKIHDTPSEEANAPQTLSKDSYCENIHDTPSEESNAPQTLSKDSYSENPSPQTLSKDSYSEKINDTPSEESSSPQTLSKDSYSGNPSLQTHTQDSYSENSSEQPLFKDSYSENSSEQPLSKDSYSESPTLQNQSVDSYSENPLQTLPVESYSENSSGQPLSKDSYSENASLQNQSVDSYSENPLQTLPVDSYSENSSGQPLSKDSYSENPLQTHSENSYSENPLQTHSEDSYSENTLLQAQSKDSHSENIEPSIHFVESEDSITPAMVPDSLRIEPKSEHGEKEEEQQQEEEEEEEERCSEEVGGGRTADLQTEGLSTELSSVHSAYSSPTEPQQPAVCSQRTGPTVDTVPGMSILSCPSSRSSFYSVLLSSGALCLPGTRDRSGRALLTVSTSSSMWSNPDCERADLLRLLLYYTSTLRKEVRALGLTVLVDARRAAPVPALFSALRSLQESTPGSIHSVLLLVSRDSSLVRLDRSVITQVEVLHSLKSVQKHVDLQQLPAEFGGSFSFSQSSWLCFRSRVEQLTNQCEDVIKLLQKTINILQNTPLPAAAQDAELLLSRYKAVIRSVLEDGRLVRLQQEGGASLSRLRREESVISATDDYRAELETVSSLYDQVDELLHRLVTLSNSRTQQLSFILDFRSLEQGFTEVSSWLQDEGEPCLKNLNEPEDSLELLKKKQTDFKNLYTTAHGFCKRGEALLSRLDHWGNMSSVDLHIYEVKIHSFWAQLQDFSQRINATEQNIERTVRLFSFLDQAYGWALEGMRHLAGVSMEECTLPDKCQAVIGCLEDYQSRHPPIPDSRFQEMKVEAEELRGERGLHQWSFAWSKCQETKKVFDRKMEAAIRTRDSAQSRCSDPAPIRSSTSSRKMPSGLRGVCQTSSPVSCPVEDANTSSPPRNASPLLPITSSPITSSPITSTPQHTPLLQRLFRSSSSDVSSDRSDRVDVCSSSPSLPRLDSPSSSSFSSRRQHLRKTQSFDCPSTPEALRYGPCPRTHSEPVRRGNTGVFIRGLEVSSTEAADRTLCPRTPAHSWGGQGCSPGTPSTPRTTGSPAADPRPRGSKLRHIVEEMITTEQEYVRSLRYIIHHYFPEMDRVDLPQDLRGKRSVVFGNLEKLLDFHSQFFLRELESCWKHPLRVPHCFLRHQEQFGLYALYSKNKPKSDALLSNHGNSFFRRKQVDLGDKMDLSSYLLKPIQRMSKYALLLTDLIKEVGVAQEAELVALQAATKMVKFQLRHGNDLLAMDAIRDCDVNLKEQGQLIRQDEFTIWSGRRKCQRHIFLFDELVLFSKPKKMEGGLDVFIYKHSFKTADVGLTESTGDSGLRFEIWFRRRTSKNQTFLLQAATPDVKHAWTNDIARLLWTQANKNKEMRLKEMVSMGVGNKPFLDIKPSDAAISDRAVHYIMKSRGARTRASIAVSVFDHSNPFKRGAVTSDPSTSGPSSSSLLGPLNLHMFSQNMPPSSAADSSFITSCIEEDEQEHETSSQPSMTTESSGSSSRCLSGSTGSDSGCVSSHLQEALSEEPSPPGQSPSSSNKQHLSSQYISSKTAAVIGPATIV
ncbi:uncharacterized protein plekhg4 [Paralichthys olivaceus]|uniref:uncharacterized protein plekhg4 n=1 Tax=Paralichthys olivaceus TaxID=8255 RepID=UPI003753498C